MNKIGIFDYGSGNFTSVWNAVCSITSDVISIKNPDDINKCTHLILPGVGTFGNVMERLKRLNFITAIENAVIIEKKQYLGICVGMQILADYGTEFGHHKGFGFIKGAVDKINMDGKNCALPHMGWNNLEDFENTPLLKDIDPDATFYFVHSYCFIPQDLLLPFVKTDCGTIFCSAISVNNIHGVQFHPEKSQLYGLQLLQNFIRL
ncbi:MAG: imidazole glycerol phosphate synthase subunit HisH [uncultured bacterium]|nr:MAG: imidazole glycerol phosphate synthase subunit HisH [uncultured bacterium]